MLRRAADTLAMLLKQDIPEIRADPPLKRFSYRGEDVVQTLELPRKTVGYPTAIRVDQG